MSRSPLYSAEHVQLPNRVLLLCSPCAPRLQVPCSASRVVPGAHRVVGPGTHRGSGPREVHTTHTTQEQCLVSITTIAHQAQGIRVGEVIAKLAEDAYFMRVDNRVTQVPPTRTGDHVHHEATSRSPADGGRNRPRGEQPQNPNRTRASVGGPSQGGNSAGGASESCGAASHGDAGGGGSSSGSSSHGAGRRAGGRGDRGGRGHAESHVTGVSRSGYDANLLTAKIRQPSHEFTFGVGMSFIPYPLVLSPVV
jgi:hypothetical protein